MSGCPKMRSSTIPGRATKAAAQPARSALAASHEMRGHELQRTRFDPAFACGHVVDRSMGLEPAHRVGGQDALELSGDARVLELRLCDRLGGVGERAQRRRPALCSRRSASGTSGCGASSGMPPRMLSGCPR